MQLLQKGSGSAGFLHLEHGGFEQEEGIVRSEAEGRGGIGFQQFSETADAFDGAEVPVHTFPGYRTRMIEDLYSQRLYRPC